MDTPSFSRWLSSPFGLVRLDSDGRGLVRLHLGAAPQEAREAAGDPGGILEAATRQLGEYFAGERTRFELPLSPDGTPFQHRVWAALREIPFGETRSYLDVAKVLGDPFATRAVGAANGRNPIALVVPCHRVIGASGRLTGYAGGLELKRALLAFEAEVRARSERGALL